MSFSSGSYKRIIAIIECSEGNPDINHMWLETKTFDRKTRIEDIVWWAKERNCVGNLLITLDETDEL